MDQQYKKPLIVLGLLIGITVLIIVLSILANNKLDKDIDAVVSNSGTPVINEEDESSPEVFEDPMATEVPSVQEGGPAFKTAWINSENVQAYLEPGLDQPPLKTFNQWDEVYWVQESQGWDKIQTQGGLEVWVQSDKITFTKPKQSNTISGPQDLIQTFFQEVSRKKYRQAYDHLSPEWQVELPYDYFLYGYSGVTRQKIEIEGVERISAHFFRITVGMQAIEEGHTVDYVGTYTVERKDEQSEWLMTSGSLVKRDSSDVFHAPAADAVDNNVEL